MSITRPRGRPELGENGYTKEVPKWAAYGLSRFSGPSGAPLGVLAEAEARAQNWHKHWGVGQVFPDPDFSWCGDEPELEPPSHEELLALTRAYSTHTAAGACGLRPRRWSFLDGGAVAVFLCIWEQMQRLFHVP
eukprot:1496562-Pyramimonas_sp.AAC.1